MLTLNCCTASPTSSHLHSSTGTGSADTNSSSNTNTGAVAGGVVGGIAGLALLAGLLWFLLRRRKGPSSLNQFDTKSHHEIHERPPVEPSELSDSGVIHELPTNAGCHELANHDTSRR